MLVAVGVRKREKEDWRRLEAIEAEAVARGLIAPIGAAIEERRQWRACDLASLIEGCFHRRVEPQELDDDAAQPWIERLRGSFVVPRLDAPDEPLEPERRYWLVHAGRPVGTIKLGVSRFRGPWLWVHSLYVRPEERGRGIAGRRLEALAAIASRHDRVGIRLGTSWTWQKSLRFYLDRDFWVYLWKHSIDLVLQPRLPRRRFIIEGGDAHFELVDSDGPRRLWTARRVGDQLVLDDSVDDDFDWELAHLARATFAMLLALAGWPLVRSEEHWARRYLSSDVGAPEGLAYKIGIFERVARDQGWTVDTVRIPGLDLWQAWERGEEHGRDSQILRDIEEVLRQRGWQLDELWKERIQSLEHYFGLNELLRRAVSAASHDEWLDTATELVAQQRRSRK